MIEHLLVKLQEKIGFIETEIKKKTGLKFEAAELVRQVITQDLQQLQRKDPTFLDGIHGYIDYYSPYAELQLKNKQVLLEKYLSQLQLIESTLFVLAQKTKEGKALKEKGALSTEADKKRLDELKNEITALLGTKDTLLLAEREDIKAAQVQINDLNSSRKALKDAENVLKMDESAAANKKLSDEARATLQQKISDLMLQIKLFDDDMKVAIGFTTLQVETDGIEIGLKRHRRIVEQIPKGMVDVKRALYFVQERRLLQRQIQEKQRQLDNSTSENTMQILSDKTKLEERLALLPPMQLSTTAEVDESIKSMLEDLRQVMTDAIKGYQEIAISGGDINAYLHQTTAFYWETLFLYRRTLAAIDVRLQEIDTLTPEGQDLARYIANALAAVPSSKIITRALAAIKNVDGNLQLRDEAYKAALDEHTAIRFYKGAADSLVTKISALDKGPLFFLPYNANNYVLDQPAHMDIMGALGNCFGETQMFLKRINSKDPTFNNICPETDLINFQLEQKRRASGKPPKTLGIFEADKSKKEFANWGNLKHLLTKEAESTQHGDLCWLRFSGARAPGYAKEIAHAMGFLKLKNPSPYKYIIYDYNLGAMGFSSDEQLQVFFESIFEGVGAYYPYSKCILEKIDEISAECQNFINGEPGIKSLAKPDPTAHCVHHYWNANRVGLFIKYYNGRQSSDLELILEKIPLVTAEHEKQALYQQLFHNPHVTLNALLKLAINNSNIELMDSLLQNDDCPSISGQMALSQQLENHIVQGIEHDKISPKKACMVFGNQKKIVLAAAAKNPEVLSVVYAKHHQLVEQLVKNGELSAKTAAMALPMQAQFKEAAQRIDILQHLEPLKKPLSFEECQARVDTLQALYQQHLNYHLAEAEYTLKVLLKNACDTLIAVAQERSLPVVKETLTYAKNKKLVEVAAKMLQVLEKDHLAKKKVEDARRQKEHERRIQTIRTMTSKVKLLELNALLNSAAPAEQASLYTALLSNNNLSLEQLVLFAVEAEQTELLSKLIQQEAFKQRKVHYPGAPELKSKLLDFINTLSPELQCRLMPEHPAVVLAAYRMEPRTIQYADKILVHRLVQQEQVSSFDALLAFPDDAYLQHLYSYQKKLAYLDELAFDASQQELIERVYLLNEIICSLTAEQMPNSFAKAIQTLAHDVGAHLLAQINAAPNTNILPTEQRIYTTEGLSGDHLIEAITTLFRNYQQTLQPELHHQRELIPAMVNVLIPVAMGAEQFLDTMQESPGNNVVLTITDEVTPIVDTVIEATKDTKENEKAVFEYTDCMQLLQQIDAAKIDAQDDMVLAYCEARTKLIEQHKGDYSLLIEVKNDLQKHLNAINSVEVLAIKKELERLEGKKQTLFGLGSVDKVVVNKIQSIKHSLSQVPLLQRLHAFSNDEDPQCNNVRVALAEHRHFFRSSAVVDGKVDVEKTTARSFDNLQKQFKNAYKTNENEPSFTPSKK